MGAGDPRTSMLNRRGGNVACMGRRLLMVLAPLAVSGCSKDCIVTDAPTPVLARPFPSSYGDGRLGPNPEISSLEPGVPVRLLDSGYGKDFAYHEVRLPDGARGYVIWDAHVAVVKNCPVR